MRCRQHDGPGPFGRRASLDRANRAPLARRVLPTPGSPLTSSSRSHGGRSAEEMSCPPEIPQNATGSRPKSAPTSSGTHCRPFMMPAVADFRPVQPVTSPINAPCKRLLVFHDRPRLRLQFAWHRFDHVVLLAGLTCVGIMLAMTAIAAPAHLQRLLALLGIGVIVVVSYPVLAGICNRTTITGGPEEIVAEHGPLPWMPTLRLPAPDVLQVSTCAQRPLGLALTCLAADVRWRACRADAADGPRQRRTGARHREARRATRADRQRRAELPAVRIRFAGVATTIS